MEDYQKTFKEFWKVLVCNSDGSLNLDKVQRELHDFHTLMGNVGKVYDHITGGRISKPLTDSDVVCSVADDYYNQLIKEQINEENRGEAFFNDND